MLDVLSSDLVVSYIRTGVTLAVGALATWLVRFGVTVDSPAAVTVLYPVVTGVFYAVVRWAEGRWPAAGRLFGVPKPPAY